MNSTRAILRATVTEGDIFNQIIAATIARDRDDVLRILRRRAKALKVSAKKRFIERSQEIL